MKALVRVTGMGLGEANNLVKSQKGDFFLEKELTPEQVIQAKARKANSEDFDFEEITPEGGKETLEEKDKAFQDRCVEYLETLLSDGANAGLATEGLAGIDSETAWKIRENHFKAFGENFRREILHSLAGIDSERAWKFREESSEMGSEINFNDDDICKSLIGLDSKRAQDIRKKITDQRERVLSYMGIDSADAWELRDELMKSILEDDVKNAIASLVGIDSDRAWKMREEFIILVDDSEEGNHRTLVESMAGIDSEKAWKIRQEYLDKGMKEPKEAIKSSLAMSLMGLDSPEAWDMRQKLLAEGVNNDHITYSLGGVDSEKAWEMREKIIDGRKDLDDLAKGLYGDYTMVAIRKARKDALEKEKGTPADIEKEEPRETKEEKKFYEIVFDNNPTRAKEVIDTICLIFPSIDRDKIESMYDTKTGTVFSIMVGLDPFDAEKIVGDMMRNEIILDIKPHESPISSKEATPIEKLDVKEPYLMSFEILPSRLISDISMISILLGCDMLRAKAFAESKIGERVILAQDLSPGQVEILKNAAMRRGMDIEFRQKELDSTYISTAVRGIYKDAYSEGIIQTTVLRESGGLKIGDTLRHKDLEGFRLKDKSPIEKSSKVVGFIKEGEAVIQFESGEASTSPIIDVRKNYYIVKK